MERISIVEAGKSLGKYADRVKDGHPIEIHRPNRESVYIISKDLMLQLGKSSSFPMTKKNSVSSLKGMIKSVPSFSTEELDEAIGRAFKTDMAKEAKVRGKRF